MRALLLALGVSVLAACDPSPQASAAPPLSPMAASAEPAAADEPVTTATIFVGDV